MAQGEDDGDDLAVSLSWPGSSAVGPDRPGDAPTPPAPPPPAPKRRLPPPPAEVAVPAAPPPQPARRSAISEARPPDPRGSPAPARRPRPDEARPPVGTTPNETLLSVLDHLSTLSRLVTSTSKTTTAELDTLGSRVEKAVAELDALQLRVLRSLAGFDALRLRVQKELADRPPLTDDDVDRIADAVTQRLLDSVRVETESTQR